MEISTQTITEDITTTMTQTPDVPVVDADSQTVELVQTIETQTDVTGDPPLQNDEATQTVAKLPTRKSLLEDMLLETTLAEIAPAEQPQS